MNASLAITPLASSLRRIVIAVTLSTFIPAAGGTAWAEGVSWNQFRGPGGSGIAPESRAPAQLGKPAWKVPISGGHSSPVLAGGHIFLTAVENGRLITQSLDPASGASRWKIAAPEVPLEPVHAVGSPAASTPFADARCVYVYFGSYGLICYDHAGVEQWKKPIPTPRSLYGMATSLIAYRDALILVLDNDADLPESKLSQSKIIAVNKSTGAIVWETPRPFVRSGWSTPAIWTHDGIDEIVVLGSGRLSCYDPTTGAEKWFATGFSRETIAQPVCGAGHVFAAAAMLGGVPDEQPDPEPFWKAMLTFDTNGDGRIERGEITEHFTFPLRPELPVGHPGFGIPLPQDPVKRKEHQERTFASSDKDKDGYWTHDEFVGNMSFNRGKPRLVAVRPGGQGDVTTSHVDWQLHRNIPEVPSPLFHRNRLYLVRDGGVLTAVDATNGNTIYSERLGALGQYSASPVLAGENLYLISNRGVVSVVKSGDTFQLLHQQDLGEASVVTPAFDDNTIYIRTQGHLWAFRAR